MVADVGLVAQSGSKKERPVGRLVKSKTALELLTMSFIMFVAVGEKQHSYCWNSNSKIISQ